MPRKSQWNSPTTAIRIPEHCADDLLAIAKLLDAPPNLHWDGSVATNPQALVKLSQFHTHIEVLVRELKRERDPLTKGRYEELVDHIWNAVQQYQEVQYRLFCQRTGQQPTSRGRSEVASV